MNKVTLPPGTYYVGDPGYCFSFNKWDSAMMRTNCFAKEFCDKAGQPVLVAFRTYWGDGCYTGSDGFEYGVDSGTLGMVNVRFADMVPRPNRMRKVTVSEPVECYQVGSKIILGSIKIETNPRDEEG